MRQEKYLTYIKKINNTKIILKINKYVVKQKNCIIKDSNFLFSKEPLIVLRLACSGLVIFHSILIYNTEMKKEIYKKRNEGLDNHIL